MEDHGQNPIDAVQPVMSVEDLIQMRTEVANVYISYEIADYISRLVMQPDIMIRLSVVSTRHKGIR